MSVLSVDLTSYLIARGAGYRESLGINGHFVSFKKEKTLTYISNTCKVTRVPAHIQNNMVIATTNL
jgi:hypothetical protein